MASKSEISHLARRETAPSSNDDKNTTPESEIPFVEDRRDINTPDGEKPLSTTHDRFTCFPDLFSEVRLMIWAFVPEPRTIALCLKSALDGPPDYYRHWTKAHTLPSIVPTQEIIAKPSPLPSLLHACHESREYGLKVYSKLSLGGYINWDLDTLLISPDIFPNLGLYSFRRPPGSSVRDFRLYTIAHETPPPLLQGSEATSLKHVAFYIPTITPQRSIVEADYLLLYHMASILSGDITQLSTVTYVTDWFTEVSIRRSGRLGFGLAIDEKSVRLGP
ncbi:hypothetical protein G7Y89_g10775 [Cudoniella acicularis]|uniref:2EXR domain-containing protein n=1 Tax=Cudoniella acicularis TaxID=354080 RepID=A0A8H4RC40_9HELO|nr:hypothetical protein G7Y89_g10775 [Cudoniella acicularis]